MYFLLVFALSSSTSSFKKSYLLVVAVYWPVSGPWVYGFVGSWVPVRHQAPSWSPTRSGLCCLISAARPFARFAKSVRSTSRRIAPLAAVNSLKVLAFSAGPRSAPRNRLRVITFT